MRIFLLTFLISANAFAQNIAFSPSSVLERTVSLTYYNTDYIFITNISDEIRSLSFELVDFNFPSEWSVTGCTNVICYTKVPDDGTLGTIQPDDQAYLSINLAVNGIAGDGEIRFVVFDQDQPQLKDTVSFVYHAQEDQLDAEPQPWAKINFAQNVLTVFLKNESAFTALYIFDVNGKRMMNMELGEISSYSMSEFPVGIYVVVVRDENGKELIQKVVKT